MLSSRSLRIIGSRRPYIAFNTSRQYSSTLIHSKSQVSPTSKSLWTSKSNLRPRLLQTAPVTLIGTTTTLRFQSTTSSNPEEIPVPPTSSSVTTDFLETSTESLFEYDPFKAVEVNEYIGYLKSLGLDYGWGPTSVMEWLLEHIHIGFGLSWLASIVVMAVGVRVVFFPLYRASSDTSAKLAAIKDLTVPIAEKLKQALATKDMNTVALCQEQLKSIHRQADLKAWKAFLPLLQMFPAFGMFKLLRGMAALPVPGLENGGILWFSNLTVADPLYILPFGASLSLYYLLKKGGESGVQTMGPAATHVMSLALPTISFLFVMMFPAGLQAYFIIGSVLSIVQARAFANNEWRERLGMTPMPKRPGLASQDVSQPKIKYQAPRAAKQEKSMTPNINEVAGKWGSYKSSILEGLESTRKDFQTVSKSLMGKVDEMVSRGKMVSQGKVKRKQKRKVNEKKRASRHGLGTEKQIQERRETEAAERKRESIERMSRYSREKH